MLHWPDNFEHELYLVGFALNANQDLGKSQRLPQGLEEWLYGPQVGKEKVECSFWYYHLMCKQMLQKKHKNTRLQLATVKGKTLVHPNKHEG